MHQFFARYEGSDSLMLYEYIRTIRDLALKRTISPYSSLFISEKAWDHKEHARDIELSKIICFKSIFHTWKYSLVLKQE